MTLRTAESCGKKCLNQLPGKSVTDHETAQADQVQIVVLHTLVRGKCFVNEARADAGNFIRGDRCSYSAATDGHATLHISAGNGARQRHDIIRIVIVELRVLVSEIHYFITGLSQPLCEMLLQLEAAVVGGNANQPRWVW